jgi:hypothetical protein
VHSNVGIFFGYLGFTSGWTLVDLMHITYAFAELIFYYVIVKLLDFFIASCKSASASVKKTKKRTRKRRARRRGARLHERLIREQEEFWRWRRNQIQNEPQRTEGSDGGTSLTITRSHPILPPLKVEGVYRPRLRRRTRKFLDEQRVLELI